MCESDCRIKRVKGTFSGMLLLECKECGSTSTQRDGQGRLIRK